MFYADFVFNGRLFLCWLVKMRAPNAAHERLQMALAIRSTYGWLANELLWMTLNKSWTHVDSADRLSSKRFRACFSLHSLDPPSSE